MIFLFAILIYQQVCKVKILVTYYFQCVSLFTYLYGLRHYGMNNCVQTIFLVFSVAYVKLQWYFWLFVVIYDQDHRVCSSSIMSCTHLAKQLQVQFFNHVKINNISHFNTFLGKCN